MAKIHLLQSSGNNLYSAVVHAATPGGNNSASVPWSTAISNSGLNTSILVVGTGAGQITNSENNQVQAGTVIEAQFLWQDDPTLATAERLANLDLVATQSVTALLADLQNRLRFFGMTRT